jgi:peptide/nickel transport system ATP-binding protein
VDGEEIEATALGQEEKRKLRMEYISYVPQGSMSVLNPVLKVNETYQDFVASHVKGKKPCSRSRTGRAKW